MNKNIIDEIFSIWAADNPEPETELEYTNVYTLLVAVVLSAQSTDVGVNKATKELWYIADNPEDMVKLGEDGLKKYIKTIGLYNTKAKNVILLSKMLIDDHNGEVPKDLNELQKLPGVGRKTANVVMNCAWGEKTIAVDTHVFRVSNRVGIVAEKDVLKTEKSLLKNIPDKWLQHAHHWLILHGRYICKARKPLCSKCNIYEYCEYKEKEVL